MRINPISIFMFLLWFSISALLSLFVASAFWIGIAGIVGSTVLLLMALIDIKATIIFWIISMPTIFIYANNFLKSIPVINADRVFFGVIVVCIFYHIAFRHFKSFPLGRVEKCMIAFFIIITMSTMLMGWPKAPRELRQDFILILQSFGMPFFAFFISKNLMQDNKYINILLFSFTFVGCYLAIVGILQIYFGMSFFVPRYLELNHPGRATGSFSNAVEYGSVLVIMLMYTIYQAFRYKHNKPLVLFLALCSAGMLVTIVLSKTRAVWLALLLVFIVIQKFDKDMRKLSVTLTVVATLGLSIAGSYLVESDLITRRLESLTPLYNRAILYGTAVKMIACNPVIGVGFGRKSFQKRKPEYLVSVGHISPQWGAHVGVPHNEFLHMFALTGIVGFTPYILIFIFSLKDSIAFYRELEPEDPDRKFVIYFWGVYTIFVINAMFADIVFFTYLGVLFYFMLGIVEGKYELIKSVNSEEYTRV